MSERGELPGVTFGLGGQGLQPTSMPTDTRQPSAQMLGAVRAVLVLFFGEVTVR